MVRDGFAVPSSDQTRRRLGRDLRRRGLLVLGAGFRRRSPRRHPRPVAARHRAAPLRLAGAGAVSDGRRQRLPHHPRRRLATLRRIGADRRAAARAVQLYRLRACAARPRRPHSAVLRRTGRASAGALSAQGTAAAAPHRRRCDDPRRPRGDRRRGSAHAGLQRRIRRSAVRRRRLLLCDLRHIVAAVARSGDARGRDHKRAVARRSAGAAVQFRQYGGGRVR